MTSLICNQLEPSKTLGIHGTSIEQVVEALKKGRFEKERFSRKHGPILGDTIHFLANMRYFGDYFRRIGIPDDYSFTYEGIIRQAKESWARDIAFRHYLAVHTNDTEPLGWGRIKHEMEYLERKGRTWNFDDFFDPLNPPDYYHRVVGHEFLRHLDSEKISRERLFQLLQEGYERKGCLVGLNEKCKELKIERGESGFEYEAQLHIPQGGLPLGYISGIVPLGQSEKRILKDLDYTCSK